MTFVVGVKKFDECFHTSLIDMPQSVYTIANMEPIHALSQL